MEKSCENCGNEVGKGSFYECKVEQSLNCIGDTYKYWISKDAGKTKETQLPNLYRVLDEKYRLAVDKNADYGNSFDKIMDKLVDHNIDPLQGLYIRLADKFNRFETLLFSDTHKVKDESIRDTLRDASNYIDMFMAWEAGRNGKM